jgi:hypothetical protein
VSPERASGGDPIDRATPRDDPPDMTTATRDPEQDVRTTVPPADASERFARRRPLVGDGDRSIAAAMVPPIARSARAGRLAGSAGKAAPATRRRIAALAAFVQSLGDGTELDALDALARPSRSPAELEALAARIRAGAYAVDAHAVADALVDRLLAGRAIDAGRE